MEEKKVSLVIATYRREETLKRAVESALAQSYANLDVVVVDDNADEKWNRIVADIVGSYPSIVYIRNKENKGSAESKNIGIRAAHGEYVTFLDDDDVYLENKVKNQVDFMMENNLDFCATDLELYYEDGTFSDRRRRTYIKETDTESLLKYHLMYHITGTDTLMFRREYLLSFGAFGSINYGDEFYCMEKAIKNGGKFGYLPVCDIKAYVHILEDGMSSGQSKIDGENAVYEHVKTYFPNLDFKSRKYIRMRHYAVLAFARKRQKKYFRFFIEGIKSFFSSPIACLKLLKEVKK